MLSTLCPYCERQTHMTQRWSRYRYPSHDVQIAATCDYCHGLSVAMVIQNFGLGASTTEWSTISRKVNASSLIWLPRVGDAPAVEDVPAHIERAAKEAYSSASVGNHMAAILMARTVVEATAKDKGITTGNLVAKIDAMKDANLIRPAIAAEAHEIRHAGNDMAHGDITAEVDSDDADEVLALMSEVLSEVFQGPARLKRVSDKREARKAAK